MRIAVLLYGHLRDFDNCASSLKKYLLDIYNCDVFIHTWDETEPSTFVWHKGRSKKRFVGNNIIEKINNIYVPKQLSIEHQEKWTDEQIIESNYSKGFKFSTAGIHFMFYSMSKANGLRKQFESNQGFNYDFVVVTRPDVQLKSTFDIKKSIEQAKILGLDMNKCRYFASTPLTMAYPTAFYINEPNDLLFFGCPQTIDKYIDVNMDFDNDYLAAHTINVVSNFTAKELEAGILPIPLSYSLGVDWSFSRYRKQNFHFPFIKQVLIKTGIYLLRPLFKLLKKHPVIVYYNDCK